MRYVIGSGPAGIACAHALVNQGHDVTILDAGLELESERRALVESLRQNHPDTWTNADLDWIKEGMSPEDNGVPLKYIYGSDFPYREAEQYIPLKTEGVENLPSLAKAGLSNVWGAGLLPYLAHDIREWPISVEDLAPHYEAVLSFMPMSAVKDDLASIFPLYSKKYQTLHPSRQAVALIEDLKRHQNALASKGVKFGYSRLAVRSEPSEQAPGCIYCGLCMYGCPYELIYNTNSTLRQLKQAGNLNYIKDVVVQKLVESNNSVKIIAQSRVNGESLKFEAAKVYLACGVLPTTKILLESLQAYERLILLKDSQYFLLPLLRYQKNKNVTDEKLHTLQQVFLELFDSEISQNTIHLAIYTYNEMYLELIKKKLGKFYPALKFIVNEFIERMILAQGYLHSSLSPTISLKLHKQNNEQASQLIITANKNEHTKKIIKKIISKLWNIRKYTRAIPITPMLRIAASGRGFHTGGSFPMKANPSNFESDILGRPTGFKNVHVVDATVFPSIPGTKITLSVMANAYRIASNS